MAALYGAQKMAEAYAARQAVNIILATGASQFDMLATLVAASAVPWSAVTCFHLDEY